LQSIFSGDRFPRNLTRRSSINLMCSAFLAPCLRAGESTVPATQVPDMTRNIPPRSSQALTGSQFVESVSTMDRQQRERAILGQLLEGNVPGFLRKWAPVQLSCEAAGGKPLTATIFVMPEYLAIGSDRDFLRIPMDLHTATAIANRFRCVLPTTKMVDAIHRQATSRFTPQPLPAGPQMTSTDYYRHHNGMIDEQFHTRGFSLGALSSGHKKDVVVTNRLNSKPGRIAIYGWHRDTGEPIQPLSTVHGADYADYSHGIRLIAGMAVIEGRLRCVRETLRDSLFAKVLSDEGVLRLSAAPGNG
jgi:hypothetical protein